MTNATILDNLIDRLRKAAIYNRHDLAAPSVVLWTDEERLWSKVIPLLRAALPELFVLAPEVADERTGPSTWLRYQLARAPVSDGLFAGSGTSGLPWGCRISRVGAASVRAAVSGLGVSSMARTGHHRHFYRRKKAGSAWTWHATV